MIRILLWIVVCAAIVLIFHRRLAVTLASCLILCAAVPYGVSRELFASAVAVHPGTWLILVCFASQLLWHADEFGHHVSTRWRMYLACLAVVLGAALFTMASSYALPGGLTQTVDQLVAPLCLLLMTYWALETGRLGREQLARVLVAMGVAECLLALAQEYTTSYIFYTDYYAALDHRAYGRLSMASQLHHRYMGTLEHPLTLSLVACACIPLLTKLRSKVLASGGALILLGGILASESRVGLIVGTAAAFLLVIKSGTRIGIKVMLGVVVASAYVLMTTSALSSGTINRFSDDLGSSVFRGQSFSYYLDHWSEYLVQGNGVTSSYQITADYGLRASLESGILMYTVDIGTVLTALMLAVQLCLVYRAYKLRDPSYVAASSIAILVPLTYSSIGTQSVASVFVWMVLAVGAGGLDVDLPLRGAELKLPTSRGLKSRARHDVHVRIGRLDARGSCA